MEGLPLELLILYELVEKGANRVLLLEGVFYAHVFVLEETVIYSLLVIAVNLMLLRFAPKVFHLGREP